MFKGVHLKVVYDPETDRLQISFTGELVEETAQIAPGLILDYDEDGLVIGFELRNAAKKVTNPYAIDYSIGPANLEKPQPQL
jgi:uncharacterized protein YuzE